MLVLQRNRGILTGWIVGVLAIAGIIACFVTYGVEARLVFPPTTFDALGPQEPVPGLEPGFVLTIARDRVYKNIAAAQEVFQTGEFGQLAVVG